MRVIFDANVLLSFLLAPDAHKTIPLIVRTCLTSEAITVVVPARLVQETVTVALSKRYFQGKISGKQVEELLQPLMDSATPVGEEEQEFTRYVRDANDDYLVAHGLVQDVDYLVTGDRDLLVLDKIEQLQVVTPAAFRRVLQQYDYL